MEAHKAILKKRAFFHLNVCVYKTLHDEDIMTFTLCICEINFFLTGKKVCIMLDYNMSLCMAAT